MPRGRKSRTRRNRQRGIRRARRSLANSQAPTTSARELESKIALHDLLRSAVLPKETKDGWKILARRSADEKDAPAEPVVSLGLLRGLFPSDKPYTCQLGYHGLVATNGSGVLTSTQSTYPVLNISSVAEWSSIAALFDEFYVHTMKFSFKPFNKGGFGLEGTAQPSQGTFASTASIVYALSAGLSVVSIFGSASGYTTAQAHTANPTRRLHHSGDEWSFTWRNNVRFDPHGYYYYPTAVGWQGWTPTANASDYGGLVQVRAINDQVFGDGTHAVNLGTYELLFVATFRTRA